MFISAKANRVPEIQRSFGPDLNEALAFKLTYGSLEWLKRGLSKFPRLSQEERLDVLHQLRTVGSSLLAMGSEPDAFFHFKKLVADLSESANSPIEKYAISLTVSRLEKEKDDPSIGLIVRQGDPNLGRLSAEYSHEIEERSDALFSQIRSDVQISFHHKFYPVASDTVAILDHSDIPQYLGKVEWQTLEKNNGVSFKDIDLVKSNLERIRENSFHLEAVLRYLNHNVFEKVDPPIEWAEVSNILSAEEWNEYIALSKSRGLKKEEIHQKKIMIHEKIGSANEKASEKFVSTGVSLLAQLQHNPFLENILAHEAARLDTGIKEKDLETMFVAVENIAKQLEILKTFRNEELNFRLSDEERKQMEKFISLRIGIIKEHANNNRKADEEMQDLYTIKSEKEAQEILRFSRLNDRLGENQEELIKDIQEKLEKIEKALPQTQVHFQRYENIPDDLELNPYRSMTEKDLSLLLQHLHEPEMRRKIESDLGISFEQIPLRSQIHFLRFLAGQDEKGFERLQGILKDKKETGNQIINSFLSNAESPEYAESVLRLAEKLDQKTAAAVFGKYQEIAAASEKVRECLIENFRHQPRLASDEQINDFVRNLLHEGNELLADLSNDAGIESSEVITKLDTIRPKLLLLEKIFKQLPREVVAGLDLREMPVITRIEDIKAPELAAEKYKNIRKQMKSSIDKQFPAGDREVFINEVLKDENIRLTITLADEQVLSFFSKERISPKIEYVDWFICNPDTKVKGLGEATIRLGLNSEQAKDAWYYAVVKPHVKSFYIFVEKMDFVAFGGATRDGEYKHHYARSRRLPADSELASKNLTPEKEQEFRNLITSRCQTDREVQSIEYDGHTFDAVRVSFHGQTHLDDIKPEDPDGWIFGETARQDERGNVLSRFIPANLDKNNQTFYAVFEKDRASEESKKELSAAIASLH